ncbi:hypothetical protein RJ640_024981 [Escallonia rubra]|uniref:Uncharacterized protein n=1 Tax=Escallonia rubra TaxID=112253 RepID=A0AA88R355_9ASTE|nr:hypothetical protein RJ640_024981 [Escallonia rubra]
MLRCSNSKPSASCISRARWHAQTLNTSPHDAKSLHTSPPHPPPAKFSSSQYKHNPLKKLDPVAGLMASACISSCVEDVARAPVRATYVNLYKWPESDAEFVRSVSSNGRRDINSPNQPRVVDSISCRQLYLRSYTFSRKESMPEKTRKCFGRVRERVAVSRRKRKPSGGGRGGGGRRKCVLIRKAKEVSCAAFASIFRRLLLCTSKVDVAG